MVRGRYAWIAWFFALGGAAAAQAPSRDSVSSYDSTGMSAAQVETETQIDIAHALLISSDVNAAARVGAPNAATEAPVDAATSAAGGAAADTWSATSLTGAPEGRAFHSAVWTGSRMIVWGGSASLIEFLNTGGVYDPETDTWSSTSTTGSPAGR